MLNEKRLIEIENIPLHKGSGDALDTACVMQMVSYVANEPWSDHPECVCPLLTRFAIRLNDRFDDSHRQLLKPLIPRLVGTRADLKTEIQRAKFLALQAVSVFLPTLTEQFDIPEITARLRAFSIDQLAQAGDYIRGQIPEIRAQARKHFSASYAAAYYAAASYATSSASYAEASASYAEASASYAEWINIRNSIWIFQVAALKQAIEVRA